MDVSPSSQLPSFKRAGENITSRLPTEILSAVFLDACSTPAMDVDSLLLPMTVSHVCGRWRRVSLRTGQLWTNITLSFPMTQYQLALAMLWLNRSGLHPLDLVFDFRDPCWSPSMEYAADDDHHPFRGDDLVAALQYFLPHVARWRRFELLTDTWEPIHSFLLTSRGALAGVEAPKLETLVVMRCNAYMAAEGQHFEPRALMTPISLFGGAPCPNLKDVTLSGAHIDWDASLPALRDLSALKLRFQAEEVMPTLFQFGAIIMASPGLRELTVDGWGPRISPGDHIPILLPSLRKLNNGIINLDHTITYLSLLRCPLLDTLRLEDLAKTLNEYKTVDFSVFVSWVLSPSSSIPLPQIRYLSLYNVHARHFASSHDLFSSLSSLTQLDVKAVSEDIFGALEDAEVCPLLRTITCPRMTAIQTQSLAECLSRRLQDGGGELEVAFGMRCDLEDDSLPVQIMRTAGISVSVEPPPVRHSEEVDDDDEGDAASDDEDDDTGADEEEDFYSCDSEATSSPSPSRA